MTDYAVKGIDDKLWEKARIKGIREGVRMNHVFKRLLEMWVKGEIEVVKDKSTREPYNVTFAIIDRLYKKGLHIGRHSPYIIGLAPPLVITKDEIDMVLEELEKEVKNIKL